MFRTLGLFVRHVCYCSLGSMGMASLAGLTGYCVCFKFFISIRRERDRLTGGLKREAETLNCVRE